MCMDILLVVCQWTLGCPHCVVAGFPEQASQESQTATVLILQPSLEITLSHRAPPDLWRAHILTRGMSESHGKKSKWNGRCHHKLFGKHHLPERMRKVWGTETKFKNNLKGEHFLWHSHAPKHLRETLVDIWKCLVTTSLVQKITQNYQKDYYVHILRKRTGANQILIVAFQTKLIKARKK